MLHSGATRGPVDCTWHGTSCDTLKRLSVLPAAVRHSDTQTQTDTQTPQFVVLTCQLQTWRNLPTVQCERNVSGNVTVVVEFAVLCYRSIFEQGRVLAT
jgi:hypothetical protein